MRDPAPSSQGGAVDVPASLGWLVAALARLNRVINILGQAALVLACLILTYSVVVRYYLHAPTDWQDEMAVFLIVGAVFMSAADVQAKRGHVGIEVLGNFLYPKLDRVRTVLIDIAALLFCAFFAWKSWTLFHEAWSEGQVTSSTWGPPLWIPYSVMATGMTLLAVQLAAQILVETARLRARP
jgi:TRAP-type C4-dicarboxylate transport system permease small subunit